MLTAVINPLMPFMHRIFRILRMPWPILLPAIKSKFGLLPIQGTLSKIGPQGLETFLINCTNRKSRWAGLYVDVSNYPFSGKQETRKRPACGTLFSLNHEPATKLSFSNDCAGELVEPTSFRAYLLPCLPWRQMDLFLPVDQRLHTQLSATWRQWKLHFRPQFALLSLGL
jgi:hypothetical protein